jgi:hypothetical protein
MWVWGGLVEWLGVCRGMLLPAARNEGLPYRWVTWETRVARRLGVTTPSAAAAMLLALSVWMSGGVA